jgi:CRP-like cAMP-binding protein
MVVEEIPKSQVFKFFRRVDEAIEQGQMARALRLILTNFAKFPEPGPLRERVALALASRGRKKEAVQIYELVARHYANAGYPVQALACIKQMQSLHPDTTALLDHFSALYNVRSPYFGSEPHPAELPDPTAALDMSAREPAVGESDLFELACERALQKRGVATQPANLPQLPLLSLFPAETLRSVLDHIGYEIFAEGQTLIQQGETVRDLIWSVSPTLTIRTEREALRVPCGALIGLSGMGKMATPSEVRVVSARGAEILRLPARALAALAEDFTDFHSRVSTLRRHALTERLMSSHGLFVELSLEERAALMERFVGLHLERGERLIRQSEGSPGLYILLEGQIDIMRADDALEVTLATLKPGDICGEIGLVSDNPAVASAVMTTEGILLFLSREEFVAAAARHPALARYAVQIAQQRMQEVSAVLTSDDLSEVE